MQLSTAGLRAQDVLEAFHRDAPYLFLGAAFTTVGIVATAPFFLRRKRDWLTLYFALFAILYGQRLWVQSDLLRMALPGSELYHRLRFGINYVILIPAILFFDAAAGLMSRRSRPVGYGLAAIGAMLAALTLLFGHRPYYNTINNVGVVIFVTMLLWRRAANPGEGSRSATIIRRGLWVFGVGALLDNVSGLLTLVIPRVEPFGFAVLLGCLGYVVVTGALERDQQLSDIHVELEVAQRMQLAILPAAFPASSNFKVAARYLPMTSVAGDFYDYIVTGDHAAGLLIADVSGHGVPAAMIASMVKMAAASQRDRYADPAAVLTGMNAALLGNTQNSFVTAAYVYLDSQLREIRYSAAGHPAMLLLRGGKVSEVVENGLMLAAFDFATYTSVSQPLEAGDRLVLYTDGIVEAADAQGTEFGSAALAGWVAQTGGRPASVAADQIIAAVQRWSAHQDDDLTVLVCDFATNPTEGGA